jgi:lipopolysaccharide/colanic/teichoic acid biosynthesis glycosyltransferase
MFKSIFDRTVALLAFTVLFIPVVIPVWVLIRATSRGNAIYGQTRIGKGCRPFMLYKFRSMYQGSDAQGFQTQEGDARITPIGRILRKTSVDELPQLFNVLKGDMSLIGPRPDTPMQESNYTPADWQLRHAVRPGITGLAQVNGRSNISTEARLAFDLEYVRTQNFLLDIRILLKTVLIALGRDAN